MKFTFYILALFFSTNFSIHSLSNEAHDAPLQGASLPPVTPASKISKELATKALKEIESRRLKANYEASVELNDLMNAKVSYQTPLTIIH